MAEVIILTGTIQSGKTTALQKWVKMHNAAGLLTPDVDGKRVLYSIAENLYYSFQSPQQSSETVSVGRYHFYKEAFDHANKLLTAKTACDWLVIDEIGQLELQEQGFFPAVMEILKGQTKVLLVVRTTLVDAVVDKFSLQTATRISVKDLEEETMK